MSREKRFCVIAVDYEYHVPRQHDSDIINSTSIHRGLKSLKDQTFKDFNVVICHDGPKDKSYYDEGIDLEALGISGMLINTPERNADWGHSSRDLAMRTAYENDLGEYYIQFNIDNEFFPNAFHTLDSILKEIEEKVVTFGVHHWKALGGNVLTGSVARLNSIDAMQLVAHKDVWRDMNFWYDKSFASDGIIYEEMCKKNKWKNIPVSLGHNF